MPKITFEGKAIECETGQTLRSALLAAGTTPHNGQSSWFNCKGFGSCGTCAVKIIGKIHGKTVMEKWRLSFPPHQSKNGLRLACQIIVTEDLIVEKHDGFWGQKVDTADEPSHGAN